MSATHTPGPWSLEPDAERSHFKAVWANATFAPQWADDPNSPLRLDDGNCIVTHVLDAQGKSLSDEAMANARLIAAAPELLAALIELAGNIGAASLARNPYGKELRAKAAAAIALATTAAEGVA